jgi:sialidase-1
MNFHAKTNTMKFTIVTLLALFVSFQFMQCNPANSNNAKVSDVELVLSKIPVFIGKKDVPLYTLNLQMGEANEKISLKDINLKFTWDSQLACIANVSVTNSGTEIPLFGSTDKIKLETAVSGNSPLLQGANSISFNFTLKDDAILTESFEVQEVELTLSNKQTIKVKPESKFTFRPAKILRAAGQDNCDTYRIPGLITTNSGTLIAVYDNRYNNSKDLQEDVDIGMSRSTDGGQTWEPMRVIMDMGEWGGNPESLNGIGDPCVLYDEKNSTIWVAALWMSGATVKDMLWWASKPGMKPTETGQFMLAKSTDDGLTWSEPINITRQIKDPAWQLLLQGPGMGISMKNGTLVFPAQFKSDIGEKSLDGGQYTCHSTIVYSTDGGENWQIGAGAKTNTTEAQVAELADGTLMLNMRDDLNRKDKSETNGRAVSVTKDMGKTWQTHPTSNSALPEPNCMASLISAETMVNGSKKHVLFFSNPNNKNERTNMTIKASLDEGMTWPAEYQVELNEEGGYGYSSLTMVDENTVGILYEGVKDLFFQKIPVTDILGR